MRTALIGYGKMADIHALAVSGLPEFELAAVAGRNDVRRDEFAARWGIASYPDIREMIKREKIELAIIVTPHPQHAEHSIAAMEAGAHVLTEKPMAVNLAQAEAMDAARRKHDRVLSVVSQRRWYPASLRIREAITDGKIGKPALGQVSVLGWRDQSYYDADSWRGTWAHEGGGVCINQASHQLDLLCWYLGDPAEVKAFRTNVNHPGIEVEDSASVSIQFGSGALASLLLSNSQKPGLYSRVHIHGDSGYSCGVQTDGGSMFLPGREQVFDLPYNDLWTIPGEEELPGLWKEQDEGLFRTDHPSAHFLGLQLRDVKKAIETGCEPLVGIRDGMRVLQILQGIYGESPAS